MNIVLILLKINLLIEALVVTQYLVTTYLLGVTNQFNGIQKSLNRVFLGHLVYHVYHFVALLLLLAAPEIFITNDVAMLIITIALGASMFSRGYNLVVNTILYLKIKRSIKMESK